MFISTKSDLIADGGKKYIVKVVMKRNILFCIVTSVRIKWISEKQKM